LGGITKRRERVASFTFLRFFQCISHKGAGGGSEEEEEEEEAEEEEEDLPIYG